MGNSILEALLGAAALGVAAKVAKESRNAEIRKNVADKFSRNYANRWVCPRCGTTNMGDRIVCTLCKNQRPR